jgi:hypothetical protein
MENVDKNIVKKSPAEEMKRQRDQQKSKENGICEAKLLERAKD